MTVAAPASNPPLDVASATAQGVFPAQVTVVEPDALATVGTRLSFCVCDRLTESGIVAGAEHVIVPDITATPFVGLTEPLGSAVSASFTKSLNSNAPMSHALPCGRATYR